MSLGGSKAHLGLFRFPHLALVSAFSGARRGRRGPPQMKPSSPGPEQKGSPEPGANRTRFEPLALLLLSLATVGTAWCSFQAATWAGISQRLSNLSASASRYAVTHELNAYQLQLVDVLLFSQYINARAGSNEPLARFYAERFRGEAKTAFAAWQATRPFENPDAPPHPFVTNLYQPRQLAEARVEEAESQHLFEQAGAAGRTSRGYVLVTVLLASALFCGGTAPKFGTLWGRRMVLAFGLGAFLFALFRLWSLPVQL